MGSCVAPVYTLRGPGLPAAVRPVCCLLQVSLALVEWPAGLFKHPTHLEAIKAGLLAAGYQLMISQVIYTYGGAKLGELLPMPLVANPI